jgi:hypothetical protein
MSPTNLDKELRQSGLDLEVIEIGQDEQTDSHQAAPLNFAVAIIFGIIAVIFMLMQVHQAGEPVSTNVPQVDQQQPLEPMQLQDESTTSKQ